MTDQQPVFPRSHGLLVIGSDLGLNSRNPAQRKRMADEEAPSTAMLDERKAAILKAVIEEYIDTAQPVGSSAVVSADDTQVSAAPVRNDMSVLEIEGYLTQPHTSAGRVPTEKGYRHFVDNMDQGELSGVERRQA
ncbi:MAG: hypothetical protein GY773_00630, partial [Actinomycetia bacterium]|nr:hypothetical protein [Actinomycetes bacterium]